MSGQASVIESLMQRRIALVGRLSQANAEHLRTLQLSSGIDILRMKESELPETSQSKLEADINIASSLVAIDKLEFDLTQVDKLIEDALNEEA